MPSIHGDNYGLAGLSTTETVDIGVIERYKSRHRDYQGNGLAMQIVQGTTNADGELEINCHVPDDEILYCVPMIPYTVANGVITFTTDDYDNGAEIAAEKPIQVLIIFNQGKLK